MKVSHLWRRSRLKNSLEFMTKKISFINNLERHERLLPNDLGEIVIMLPIDGDNCLGDQSYRNGRHVVGPKTNEVQDNCFILPC